MASGWMTLWEVGYSGKLKRFGKRVKMVEATVQLGGDITK